VCFRLIRKQMTHRQPDGHLNLLFIIQFIGPNLKI